jgi:MipA family protein
MRNPIIFLALTCMAMAHAADLTVRVENPPANRTVVVMLFDSPDAFVKLREPLHVVSLPPPANGETVFRGLSAGRYALATYADADDNGAMNRNFIGIPSEPLGFSNRYWPKGPPTFDLASFTVDGTSPRAVDITLRSVFGKRGLFGVGAGVVASTSPYRGADGGNVQVIPAVSFIGERLQILGLNASVNLAGTDRVALALTGSFRPGAYKESDSPELAGLGDADNTFMAGLALRVDLPRAVELSLGYEHDALDRLGGGQGRLAIDRSWQAGRVTVSPRVGLNWLTADLAGAEYGVPDTQARPGRPAYAPGDTLAWEVGFGGFVELRRGWRLVLAGSVAWLPAEITGSPIVEDDRVWSGFAALNRVF